MIITVIILVIITMIVKSWSVKILINALFKQKQCYPVCTRPKMNVFCTFKIGPFVPIKKGSPENNFHLSSEFVSVAI